MMLEKSFLLRFLQQASTGSPIGCMAGYCICGCRAEWGKRSGLHLKQEFFYFFRNPFHEKQLVENQYVINKPVFFT